MARRKSKQRSSRKSRAFNITNAAESLILANAGTMALFGTSLPKFALEGWLLPNTPGAQGGAGQSWTLSAAELVRGFIPGGQNFGQSGTPPWTDNMAGLTTAVKHNLTTHGAKSLGTIIAVPVAFRVGKRLLRKPINASNKFLRFAGMGKDVRV